VQLYIATVSLKDGKVKSEALSFPAIGAGTLTLVVCLTFFAITVPGTGISAFAVFVFSFV